MQVLWSRAQARAACRCGSCLHAAIARRATTAASRRRLKVSDLFTACYSTILATAAFADAKVKEDRRKEWDRKIAEAKAGFPINESECEGTLSQQSSDFPDAVLSPDIESQAQNSLYTPTWGGDGWKVPLRIQETSIEGKLRVLDSQLKELAISIEPVTEQEAGARKSRDIEPNDEWIEEEWDGELPPREPKSGAHLRNMEKMIANLVDRLLLQTSIFSTERSAAMGPSDIRERMNDMAQRIETLKTGFTRLPAYSWDDIDSVEEQRSALHRSLTTLCRRTSPSKPDIDLMLAKICYNLLVSTAPPSIFTYNTLLREFNRLRQPHLTEIVVESFFYESQLKLNKTTSRLILDHYRIKEDPYRFGTILKRMGGHDRSMRIKRRHVSVMWMHTVKEWAVTNKVIHRGAFLYQKMPRGAAIFDSIICGSLEMKKVRCAIRYVRAAFRDGFEVTAETFCNVIKGCLAEVDRLAGISLLRAFLWGTVYYDIPTTFYSKTVRAHLYRLLSLCGVDPFLGSQQKLPFRLPRDLLQQMLLQMSIESITESVDRFGERILSLENVFCDLETGSWTSLDQATLAVELLKRADGFDRIRAKRQRQGATEGRWTRIRSLEARLGVHANNVKARQVELIPLAFARLTTEQKNQYLESIRRMEGNGSAVETSERLEHLSDILRMQNRGQIPKAEAPPKTLPKRRRKKNPSKEKDVIKPPQTSLLVPVFPIGESGIQIATV